MSVELKIKAKHLALEPAIIRHEERRLRKIRDHKRAKQDHQAATDITYKIDELQAHRKGIVRQEARSTHLARAYIKKMPYNRVEEKCRETPNFVRIAEMVRKYGKPEMRQFNWEEIHRWTNP